MIEWGPELLVEADGVESLETALDERRSRWMDGKEGLATVISG